MGEIPEGPDEYGADDTGTEKEVELADGGVDVPFEPGKVDVRTRMVPIDALLSRLRRAALVLEPDVQGIPGDRDEVAQSRLIESLLLRIPLPSFYAVEWGEEQWMILDGTFRLFSIVRFIDPATIGARPLKLSGLQYITEYEGLGYADLPSGLRTRLDETELIVNLVRSGTPAAIMINIFERVSRGGVALSPQEMRHAMIPGPVRNLLQGLAESDAFIEATCGDVSPTRMIDREMVLRFLAFRVTDPDDYLHGDLDVFLRAAMEEVNGLSPTRIEELSADFSRAMESAHVIFGDGAFRKVIPGRKRRMPINRPLFETVSVNLAKLDPGRLSALLEKRREVLDGYTVLMEDAGFVEAISVGTGRVAMVRRRFGAIKAIFDEVAG